MPDRAFPLQHPSGHAVVAELNVGRDFSEFKAEFDAADEVVVDRANLATVGAERTVGLVGHPPLKPLPDPIPLKIQSPISKIQSPISKSSPLSVNPVPYQ